jgi:pimeloyl-ACP methyl ester carboxylesterase
MTHLEFDFESPIWRHLYRELSRDHTLIRYDARGNGLSDREVEEVSFETFVGDLETVVDAAGLERFALFGISLGCAVSIAYAARHPERVTHLILHGGYSVGWAKRARSAAEREQGAAMLTLMRHGWGQENLAFRQLFTSQFIPGGTKEQADWFNELQRISASPEDAVRNLVANGDTDVSALADLKNHYTPCLLTALLALGLVAARQGNEPGTRDSGGESPTLIERHASVVARVHDQGWDTHLREHGHWVQQEAPDQVLARLLAFMNGRNSARKRQWRSARS